MMKIIENKYLPPPPYTAIMLLGFIFVRHGVKLSERTLRHEAIHRQQMIEMLVLPFYAWYGIEFITRFALCRDWRKAYRNIGFEKEAYSNDTKIYYKRKLYSWIKYL